MNHLYKLSLTFYCLGMLTSCSSLTIHDFRACAIAPGQSGAVCDQYLVNHQVILDQPEWLALSEGWIAISPGDFVNLKVELEDACNKLSCSYEQLQAIESFFKKMP